MFGMATFLLKTSGPWLQCLEFQAAEEKPVGPRRGEGRERLEHSVGTSPVSSCAWVSVLTTPGPRRGFPCVLAVSLLCRPHSCPVPRGCHLGFQAEPPPLSPACCLLRPGASCLCQRLCGVFPPMTGPPGLTSSTQIVRPCPLVFWKYWFLCVPSEMPLTSSPAPQVLCPPGHCVCVLQRRPHRSLDSPSPSCGSFSPRAALPESH